MKVTLSDLREFLEINSDLPGETEILIVDRDPNHPDANGYGFAKRNVVHMHKSSGVGDKLIGGDTLCFTAEHY